MKKLLKNQGSVLFLVVVVMSILIIAASATYYIVSNQNSAAAIRRNSEQAYQTAVSICDTTANYIGGYAAALTGREYSEYSNTIIGKMISGNTITAEKDMTEQNMGTAEIEIKPSQIKAADMFGKNSNVFEIKVTADVNGETAEVTKLINIYTGSAEYFSRFLTITGSSEEDTVIGSGGINGALYLENGYTELTQGTVINGSLYSSGTVCDKGAVYFENSENDTNIAPENNEIAIAENFYLNSTTDISNELTIPVKYIFVGGDFYAFDNKTITAEEVYISGNCTLNGSQTDSGTTYFIGGDLHLSCSNTSDCTFYVNGDLYLGENKREGEYTENKETGDAKKGCWRNFGKAYVNGNVYYYNNDGGAEKKIICGGEIVNRIEETSGDFDAEEFEAENFEQNRAEAANRINSGFTDSVLNSDTNKQAAVKNYEGIKAYVSIAASRNKYMQWNAQTYFRSLPKLPETVKLSGWEDYAETELIRESVYGDDTGEYLYIEDRSFFLDSADLLSGDMTSKNISLNANTRDMYVYLNGKENADGRKIFTFGTNTNIFISGTHSVIFILPDDTDFVFGDGCFAGHLDVVSAFLGISAQRLLSGSVSDVSGLVREKAEGFSGLNKYLETKKDGNRTSLILKRSSISGTPHNNIFLVSRGSSGLNFGTGSSFFGFAYFPEGMLSSTDNSRNVLFGGIIAGGCTYTDYTSTMIHTAPYDYYNIYSADDFEVAEALISEINSMGDNPTLQGYDLEIGYK